MTNFLFQKHSSFKRYTTILRYNLEPTLSKIIEAIENKKKLALDNNDIDEHGLPKLTVVTDGAWSNPIDPTIQLYPD